MCIVVYKRILEISRADQVAFFTKEKYRERADRQVTEREGYGDHREKIKEKGIKNKR